MNEYDETKYELHFKDIFAKKTKTMTKTIKQAVKMNTARRSLRAVM